MSSDEVDGDLSQHPVVACAFRAIVASSGVRDELRVDAGPIGMFSPFLSL